MLHQDSETSCAIGSMSVPGAVATGSFDIGAVARIRGLRDSLPTNLGLTPQALCFRPHSRAERISQISLKSLILTLTSEV
jgi:hypothetical protein